MTESRRQHRYTEGRRIVMVGIAVNAGLGAVKVWAGSVGRSQALIADGLHSLSDLVTDLVVLLGLRYASKPRDANHPYGHGKIETLATTFVGLLLVLTGVLLGVEGVRSVTGGPINVPGGIALVTVIGSIVLKELLYRYTLTHGHRIKSSALVANAWHHRSDALSSIAALVGIVGARVGFPVLDPLGAVAVSLMIMKVGFEVVVRASRELVEESLTRDETTRLTTAALAVEGVESVSAFHSRHVGSSVVVDISITVDGDLSVAGGHEIAHRVEDALVESEPSMEVVTVHVEPHKGTEEDGA